jgi:hypothetical protein
LLGKDIKIKSNTWQSLYESIESLRKIAQCFSDGVQSETEKSNDLYFKGEVEKIIFYLVELDGKLRLDKLGVNMMHYSKKELAEKWRNDIAKQIHPDKCKHPKAVEAMSELNDIYKEMTK